MTSMGVSLSWMTILKFWHWWTSFACWHLIFSIPMGMGQTRPSYHPAPWRVSQPGPDGATHFMISNGRSIAGGFHSHGGTPIAGWWGKSRSNGWLEILWDTPISGNHYRWTIWGYPASKSIGMESLKTWVADDQTRGPLDRCNCCRGNMCHRVLCEGLASPGQETSQHRRAWYTVPKTQGGNGEHQTKVRLLKCL